MKYEVNSKHVETLGNGRRVAPDSVIDLSAAAVRHEHNQRLIETGVLVKVGGQTDDEKEGEE